MCASIAQSGERQTEDLKVPGSIPGRGISFIVMNRKINNIHLSKRIYVQKHIFWPRQFRVFLLRVYEINSFFLIECLYIYNLSQKISFNEISTYVS